MNRKQERASGERSVLETEALIGIVGQRAGWVFSFIEGTRSFRIKEMPVHSENLIQ